MKKKKPKKLKLILVDWVDSAGVAGWRSSGDLEVEIARCQTAGFLIAETKDAIRVALNRSKMIDYMPYGEIIAIPKVAITSMRVLARIRLAK